MSPLRIKSIQIKSFKAFQDLQLELAGRHLLAYGANGSGKSSLYWALYTFLQSAGKSVQQIQKYFDPDNRENQADMALASARFLCFPAMDRSTGRAVKVSGLLA